MSLGSRLLMAMLSCLLAAGCGKFRQLGTCHAIARDVNAAMDEIEAMSKAKSVDELAIARRYADLATKLAPRASGTTSLSHAVTEYVSVLRSTETALRAHQKAATETGGRPGENHRELERLVKRERAAVARIEIECGSR